MRLAGGYSERERKGERRGGREHEITLVLTALCEHGDWNMDFHCFKFNLFGVRVLSLSTVSGLFNPSSGLNTWLGQILGLFKGFVLWLAASAP